MLLLLRFLENLKCIIYFQVLNKYLNSTFHFEIIIDSHVVIRINTVRSYVCFTQFLPTVTSYKTVLKYHNWDIVMITVKIQNIAITIDHSCCSFITTQTSFSEQCHP